MAPCHTQGIRGPHLLLHRCRLSTGRTRATSPLTSLLEDLVYARNRDLKRGGNAFQRFVMLVSFDDGLVALH